MQFHKQIDRFNRAFDEMIVKYAVLMNSEIEGNLNKVDDEETRFSRWSSGYRKQIFGQLLPIKRLSYLNAFHL